MSREEKRERGRFNIKRTRHARSFHIIGYSSTKMTAQMVILVLISLDPFNIKMTNGKEKRRRRGGRFKIKTTKQVKRREEENAVVLNIKRTRHARSFHIIGYSSTKMTAQMVILVLISLGPFNIKMTNGK